MIKEGLVDTVVRQLMGGKEAMAYVPTGHFERKIGALDVSGLMREIDDARAEDAARRLRMQTTA